MDPETFRKFGESPTSTSTYTRPPLCADRTILTVDTQRNKFQQNFFYLYIKAVVTMLSLVVLGVLGQRTHLVDLFLVIIFLNMCNGSDEYLNERQLLLEEDKKDFIGAGLNLTEDEEKVDRYLVELKKEELKRSYTNFSAFLPARNFLTAKEEIQKSKVFQFIQKVPKGASLHTHMLAGVNIDYIIKNITYRDNVYGCYNSLNVFKLKVLQNSKQDQNCSWKSLKTYRKENPEFDVFLKDKLVLSADTLNQTRENVWAKFKNTFSTLYDLVSYRPVFKEYIYQVLEELYEDNVIYTELRGTFMPLYDLNGTVHDTKVFFDTFLEAVEDFKSTHSDFVGVKYIHSIYRGVDNNTLREGLEQLISFKSLYQDFIAGFDFVGIEEEGHDLVDFHDELLGVANDFKFFFHAGETNQYGHTDLNLADAILLNSSRIGHGFALAKHPKLMEMAKQRDIAIELCPISNQVLKLNEDPRNHPASVFLSKGVPTVVCNDDPSAWEASGLSYDWYVVFMAMTWEDQGLRVLKTFAQDSIAYSAMTEDEKTFAFQVWNRQWDSFIENILNVIVP